MAKNKNQSQNQSKSKDKIRKLAATKFIASDPDLAIIETMGRVGFGSPQTGEDLLSLNGLPELPPIQKISELSINTRKNGRSATLSDSLLSNGLESASIDDLRRCNSKYLNDDHLQAYVNRDTEVLRKVAADKARRKLELRKQREEKSKKSRIAAQVRKSAKEQLERNSSEMIKAEKLRRNPPKALSLPKVTESMTNISNLWKILENPNLELPLFNSHQDTIRGVLKFYDSKDIECLLADCDIAQRNILVNSIHPT